MSVEEARAKVERLLYYGALGVPVGKALVDRLILEVQAEMPCYGDEWGIGDAKHECPSCTARMKLKETADAR